MAKNSEAQTRMGLEPKRTLSPTSIESTSDIIGFLMCQDRPSTTSFVVGSHDARLPFPMRLNRETVQASMQNPMLMRATPTGNCIDRQGDRFPNTRTSDPGTITVTLNGSMKASSLFSLMRSRTS